MSEQTSLEQLATGKDERVSARMPERERGRKKREGEREKGRQGDQKNPKHLKKENNEAERCEE